MDTHWLILFFITLKGFTEGSLSNFKKHTLFNQWKQDFGKDYENATIEHEAFRTFVRNMNFIQNQNKKFNRGALSFKTNVNSLSDLSLREKQTFMNGFVLNETRLGNVKIETTGERKDTNLSTLGIVPSILDYRTFGYVTEVVDQGFFCSSCYTLAAQAALEGAIAKKFGRLQKLSSQVLIDCNYEDIAGNWGCHGGWTAAAYEYLIKNNGTMAESAYPYVGAKQSCHFNSSLAVAYMTSYAFVNGDEETLKEALATIGPLAVAINANLESLFYYWTGVYDDPACDESLNHAVTLVGYGTDYSYDPPKDYWLIKNSWGTEWGENGYLRLARGKNLCGITNYVLYPIID